MNTLGKTDLNILKPNEQASITLLLLFDKINALSLQKLVRVYKYC